MLTQLVYTSSATHLFSEAELRELLRTSRINNARAGVTGMLLYKGGTFLQVIEGPQQAIDTLYAKVCRDARHKSVIKLLSGPTLERQFGNWQMAFRNLDQLDEADQRAFSPFLSESFAACDIGIEPGRAMKLLLSFKQNMR